ncbi:MAG: type II secretion system protein [Candidatus Saccharimonadales bacterium]
MIKTTSGFTIVELLVVIALIGILTTIGFVSFDSIQSNANDASRSASMKIISDSLETFYQENGEYPGCAAMSATPSTVTATTLLGLDPAVLTSPTGISGTNSIQASCADIDENSNSDYAYIGDGSDPCITGSTCSLYTLKYLEEATGNIISIKSRHAPVLTIDKPSVPVVDVTYDSGSGNVVATTTPVTGCTGGATPQYQTSSRLNDGIWSRYTTWGTDLTTSQSASQGVKYGYKAQARCYINNASYSESVIGGEDTYIRPIATIPPTPTVSYSVPDYTSTIYTWGSSSCPTGTSLMYRYDFYTSYGFDFGWVTTTGTSATFTTSTFNQTYSVQVQAQCFNSFTSGSWSSSGSTSYYRPFPTLQVLVVAGGGGGGSSDSDDSGGGAGGGGVVFHSAKTVSSTSYGVVVGGGGSGGYNGDDNAANGGNSSFWDIVAQGGGRGGHTNEDGHDGGCGGGGAGAMDGSTNNWGDSTQGPSGGGIGYGQHGGLGQWRNDGKSGGGGGGAGQVGGNAKDPITGGGKMVGGYGLYNTIAGSGTYYGGGGGGGSVAYWGAGGLGGGGNGALSGTGANGSTNTGGGGGGGHDGGNGGSGIVIVRYPTAAMGATGGSSYISGNETVHVFTSSGTFQVF